MGVRPKYERVRATLRETCEEIHQKISGVDWTNEGFIATVNVV